MFTITLVAAQKTRRRYTAMNTIMLRSETIFLMIVFGIGIMLPVLTLKFGYWYEGLIGSIVIATFCVFSLFPFLLGVITRLDELAIDNAIDNLVEEAKEAIYSGFEAKVVNRVVELEEIGEDVVKRRREERAVQIVNGLASIGTEALDNNKKFEKLILRVVKILSRMGLQAANNKLDNAVLHVGEGLKDIGVKIAIKQWTSEMRSVIIGLERIGSSAAENGLNAKHSIVIGLWVLGAAVKEYLPGCAGDVKRSLKKLEENIDRELWNSCFVKAKDQINQIDALEIKYLYEFKEYYDGDGASY
jgi:hypothetical protein